MWGVGSKQDQQGLQYLFLMTLQIIQFIYTNHKGTYSCIEAKSFGIIFNFLNGTMQHLKFCRRCRIICYDQPLRFVDKKTPEFAQETMYPFYALGIPWFTLFYRTKEHFIHAECVSAKALYNFIRVD